MSRIHLNDACHFFGILIREDTNKLTPQRVSHQDIRPANPSSPKQGMQITRCIPESTRRSGFVAAADIGPVVGADPGGLCNASDYPGPSARSTSQAGFQDHRWTALSAALVEQLVPANIHHSGWMGVGVGG